MKGYGHLLDEALKRYMQTQERDELWARVERLEQVLATTRPETADV